VQKIYAGEFFLNFAREESKALGRGRLATSNRLSAAQQTADAASFSPIFWIFFCFSLPPFFTKNL
jgi:hypothetical protein